MLVCVMCVRVMCVCVGERERDKESVHVSWTCVL